MGIQSLAELPENDQTDNFSESDDSDKEDDYIKKTDNLILVGHVEGAASILEVYGKKCSICFTQDFITSLLYSIQ